MKGQILALALSGLLLTVSCGGGSSSTPQQSQPTTSKPAQSAVPTSASKPNAAKTSEPNLKPTAEMPKWPSKPTAVPSSTPSSAAQPPVLPQTSNSQKVDPCTIRDFKSAPTPELRRVFFNDDASFQEFENEFKSHREEALKKWLVSTATLSGVKASEIEVKPISQEGQQNMGVYRIAVASGGKSYVLKLGKGSAEAMNMWRLQNSAMTHPECWNGRKGSEFFPRFITIYEAATLPFATPNPIWDGKIVLILMEPALGNTLATLVKQATSTIWEAHRVIGRSIGTMHYLMASNPSAPMKDWKTLAHGDLHRENVFLDAHNQVTLIDFLNVKANQEVDYDVKQLEGFGTAHYHWIRELFEKVFTKEAARLGKEINYFSSGPDIMMNGDALISALTQSQIREELSKTQPFQLFLHRFDELRAFVLGYLDALPDFKRADARHYFGEVCRTMLSALTRYYEFTGDKSAKQARLDSLVKASMTPEFVHCMQDQFDEFK